jgi:hypothetical protein
MKKAVAYSAFLAFSPTLLIFLHFFGEKSFIFVSLFLFILLTPLILLVGRLFLRQLSYGYGLFPLPQLVHSGLDIVGLLNYWGAAQVG